MLMECEYFKMIMKGMIQLQMYYINRMCWYYFRAALPLLVLLYRKAVVE